MDAPMQMINDFNENSATTDGGNNPSLNIHQGKLKVREMMYSMNSDFSN
jgi:hypothetical protein